MLAEVVVLGGEHMDGPRERLARSTGVIAFLAQALDPGLERGDLPAQLDLTGGDAIVRLDLGVEQAGHEIRGLSVRWDRR